MKSTGSFPERDIIEEKIRAGLSGVEFFAPRQVDEVFRPLPPGTDYHPSPLFLLACRSCGISSDGVMIFACALETFALALKTLISLTGGSRIKVSSRSDHEHGEGMTLLISDGLILMAHTFLADLYSTDLKRLVPILVTGPRKWVGQIESMRKGREGIAVVQRSMSGTAVQAVRKLVHDRGKSMELVERVTGETDRLLSAYRKAGSGADQRSIVEAFDELYGSIYEIGDHTRPLAHYVSLVSGPLSVTSSP